MITGILGVSPELSHDAAKFSHGQCFDDPSFEYRPVFPGLQGDPFIADLSTNSPLLQGLDVIVGLGTPLHAPLDATVAQSDYESGKGNYFEISNLKYSTCCQIKVTKSLKGNN